MQLKYFVQTKYIFVTGGVSSGIGKGITTASIGKILQSKGFEVAPIKIDPYLNWDAGTLRPTEHGEVWVTGDGGEIDEDLGHYERFLDIEIPKEQNITTGQIYGTVIEKERRGGYLGKTVEAIPHVVDEVYRRISEIGKKRKADFVIVEIGGTVGEYQNEIYYRAARMMKTKGEDVIFIHTVYLPVLKHLGEMKTKPAQQSVELLGRYGIQPDFLMCRAEKEIDSPRIKKLETFCYVPQENIISDHDIEPIYELPLLFEKQELGNKILCKFGLEKKESDLREWKEFVEKIKAVEKEVKIGVVGKYFDIGRFTLLDSYVTVLEAIKHAAWNNNRKPVIEWIDSKEFEEDDNKVSVLDSLDGVIVPGGFGASGTEGKITAIKYVRENNIPYLGLCLGLQLAVVEYARNVCGLEGANSTEFDSDTPHPVIDALEEQKKKIANKLYGGTMRLGSYPATLKEGSLVWKLYDKRSVAHERHRHRYEVNPEYHEILEKNDLIFSGIYTEVNLVEFIELENHLFFVATQAHPEFTSRPLKPNPLFNGLIKACIR